MCLAKMMSRFPNESAYFRFLDDNRYKNGVFCPYCASTNVAQKAGNQLVGRWNCHDCDSSFRATQATLFQGSKVPVQ